MLPAPPGGTVEVRGALFLSMHGRSRPTSCSDAARQLEPTSRRGPRFCRSAVTPSRVVARTRSHAVSPWSAASRRVHAPLGAIAARDTRGRVARAVGRGLLSLFALRRSGVGDVEHRDDGDLRHDLDVSSRGPYRGAAGATSKSVLGRLPEVREVGTRAGLLGAESGEMDGDHRRSSSAGRFRASRVYFAQCDVWNEYSSRGSKAIEGSETPMVAVRLPLGPDLSMRSLHDPRNVPSYA